MTGDASLLSKELRKEHPEWDELQVAEELVSRGFSVDVFDRDNNTFETRHPKGIFLGPYWDPNFYDRKT